jgi:Icc-related predicted phosphoesterase
MGNVWSGNDDQLNFFISQKSRSVKHGFYPRITLASFVRVTFYDFLQSKTRNGLKDRRVEDTTRHTITNQTNAYLICHMPPQQ